MNPATWLQIAVALSRLVSWIMDTKAFHKGAAAERSKIDASNRAAIEEIRKALAAVDARLARPDGLREPDENQRQ